MEKLSLNVVFIGLFVGIAKIFQFYKNQNNNLLNNNIFICELISQHIVRLGHKPSSITKFQ